MIIFVSKLQITAAKRLVYNLLRSQALTLATRSRAGALKLRQSDRRFWIAALSCDQYGEFGSRKKAPRDMRFPRRASFDCRLNLHFPAPYFRSAAGRPTHQGREWFRILPGNTPSTSKARGGEDAIPTQCRPGGQGRRGRALPRPLQQRAAARRSRI